MTHLFAHPTGILRREFLQVGFSGFLGLGLNGLLAGRSPVRGGTASNPASRKPKSMIFVFLTGGLSHIDSLDMKPDAPEGIRGEFKPIATSVPGIQVCEHLPGLASRAHMLAIVRSLSHEHTNHLNGTHQLLTGHAQPGAFFDKIASRDDYPCYASVLDKLRPSEAGVPSGVTLPTFLMEGPLTWPGQHAGFLGPKHDPWLIRQDPNLPGFRVRDLSLPEGLDADRVRRRRALLDDLGSYAGATAAHGDKDPFVDQREQAYSLLSSGRVAHAFEIEHEDPKVRDRYGRNMFGQSLLMARRLVQAGVPIVQVNMGHVQTWDTHSGNFTTLKGRLLPPTDQGVSALLDDLQASGLLDDTLVVVTGEFGRTPRIGRSTGNNNTKDGRDHWASVFSATFAGAGVRGGQVVGASDKMGAYPASRPYSPADFAATIYHVLGIDPTTELRDRLARPIQLCQGEVMAPLFSGAVA